MSTISIEEQNKISAFLEGKHIPSGLGTEHEACSIAAINLALSGELTDTIPACMSKVIGKWIIMVQDTIPDEMRNSKEWRELLPLAAGTGREHEKARVELIMDWVWSDVLPALQSTADAGGYGTEWKAMCTLKTVYAAAKAYDKAYAAAAYYASNAAATYAAAAIYAAAADAADAADAVYAAANAANAANADYADYAANAAYAAVYAVYANAASNAASNAAEISWQVFDPIKLLDKLIHLK
jgi:hypothetical protein